MAIFLTKHVIVGDHISVVILLRMLFLVHFTKIFNYFQLFSLYRNVRIETNNKNIRIQFDIYTRTDIKFD